MARTMPVRIAAGATLIEGTLARPARAGGVVLFAHGSGSGRLSPRNNDVAAQLREAGIGTLLPDLLSPAEDRVLANRFDIALLSEHLRLAASWLATEPLTAALPLGLFGASTGAAVVSRSGRPDLAGAEALAAVTAPTLLVVGGDDGVVADLNRAALSALDCDKQLAIVPGATHLLEEPGKLEEVAALARGWFARHLGAP